ncbi:MAG TPA: serine hydrolase domain-containing protein [Gaiellaceae bacterium]|nr:serine hydrolase domain-containing protein [Gaiellaceae bacterium]
MRDRDADDLEWVDELAIEIFNDHTLAGLAVGVVRHGELARFAGVGLADAAAGRPIEADTVFRIGSITKTFTGIATLQLAEEGLLALDDPVNDHLRAFRVAHGDPETPPVTIRHLLTHTAGLGELRRWSDLVRPTIGLAAKLDRPLPSLADLYAPVLRAELPPGTKWAYANHGFAALGQLVEDVGGEPFADRLRTRIFEPLGMAHTDVLRTGRVRDRLAVGYALGRRGPKPVKDTEIVVAPAGSIFSTTADMARYVAALANGGAPLLRRESLEQMLSPQAGDDELPAMGLAFMLDRLGEHRLAGHDGGWPGFVSSLLVAPDAGVGVVAFTNTSAGVAPHSFTERCLARLLGVPGPAEAERPLVPASPHLWRELVGLYKPSPGLGTNFRWWQLLGGEVEVVVRHGHLTARAPSPLKALRGGVRLHAVDADDPLAFEIRHDDVVVPVRFARGRRGTISSVRTGSTRGGFLELHRRPRVKSLRLWGKAGAGAAAAGAGAALIRRGRR